MTEETFRRMVSVLSNPLHLLLFWLAWDIGENVDALLKLSMRDFVRQKNQQTTDRCLQRDTPVSARRPTDFVVCTTSRI